MLESISSYASVSNVTEDQTSDTTNKNSTVKQFENNEKLVSKQKKIPKSKNLTKKEKIFYNVDLVETAEEGRKNYKKKLLT